MELFIQDKKELLTHNFNRWLLKRLKENLTIEINVDKLTLWDTYLNDCSQYKLRYNRKIYAKDILMLGISNLEYYMSSGTISFRINSSVFVPGLDRIKVCSVCRLINYGCLELQGYPIFTKVFKEVKSNFSKYVDEYLYLGV